LLDNAEIELDIDILSEPEGEFDIDVVTESVYEIVTCGDKVWLDVNVGFPVIVCVPVTDFVIPVGNVVGLALNVFTDDPVADIVVERVLNAVVVIEELPVCVFDTLELALTVAVLNTVYVLILELVCVTDAVDVLDTLGEAVKLGVAVVVFE
jgi:hypothetical protein